MNEKVFQLFSKSLPNPKINACATCEHATPMIIGKSGKIYCSRTGKWSWDEDRLNIRLCGGNPGFVPENLEAIQEEAETEDKEVTTQLMNK